ncbi:unnamed protein product [Prorocentrum cordatum]|uniref:Hexosyltransferase n=3 Tax=Prorocentrum cordatum TaxID=2364126 RepID=A0ABN9WYS4_9DINO|nr:unnamed protein product [Polarella glacialis]
MAPHRRSEDMELSSDSDAAAPAAGWSTGRVLGCAALACAACAAGGFAAGGGASSPGGGLAARRELLQVLAKPAREKCSDVSGDCFDTACCDVAGFTCFVTTTPGSAQCMKNCTPSETTACAVPVPKVGEPMYLDNAVAPGTSMYCFSVYMADTGSDGKTERPDELNLLKAAYDRKIGIFACEQWGIFSDKPGDLAPGVPFVAVDDADGDFHILKRKETGTWINTGLHTQVWKAIRAAGDYQRASWVVKVDCDAVFLPSRLRPFLASQGEPGSGVPGIYLENCKYCKWGWFGNLEIMSLTAAQTLFPNIEWCKQVLDWKTGVEGGKYGPMGEDLFAQSCLDAMGVRRGGAFDTTLDAACEADRPEDQKKNKKWRPDCTERKTAAYHPMMKVGDYVKCFEKTVEAFGY